MFESYIGVLSLKFQYCFLRNTAHDFSQSKRYIWLWDLLHLPWSALRFKNSFSAFILLGSNFAERSSCVFSRECLYVSQGNVSRGNRIQLSEFKNPRIRFIFQRHSSLFSVWCTQQRNESCLKGIAEQNSCMEPEMNQSRVLKYRSEANHTRQ